MPTRRKRDDFGIPPDLVIGPEADFLPLADEANWGMEKFQIKYLREVTDGKGIIIGIIDTGVDREHPLLSNCIDAKDFTGSRYGAEDKNGHGTHCTGTVGAVEPRIGVAFGCKTVHGKGLGDSGSGSTRALIQAMDWCVYDKGAEVISNSWGSSSESKDTTKKLKEYAEKGIWPIFAAGNSGAGTPDVDWPGRSEHCIDVAALALNLSPASFTSAGAKIDTSGPGVNIWSCRPGGGFQQMSGTSMATPFVAGLLGLYRTALKIKGLPIPTVYQLREQLFKRSTDTHEPGDDRRTGPGWVTPLLLALDLTVPDPPPVVSKSKVRDSSNEC